MLHKIKTDKYFIFKLPVEFDNYSPQLLM